MKTILLLAVIFLLVRNATLRDRAAAERRRADALQLRWLEEAARRRDELEAATDALAQLHEDFYETERLDSGKVLLPPYSLN